ncbi:dolichyl-P-Man:Man(7)GlcNAc(2)-PP-dolichol alpha-1,6-mannosyltransferase [Linderina macrospora]|uniref:Dolichyl-P-Man:Man(7)GlcNAc(2)-PP-dolichol alpha-1,6-mannosyltransferase n=1 Tax=Linderina macrospora TaxID=4868 RepID=A0ACC1JAW0_9FUNG|nr:dolichyl-P-Man:Man(7)GlcNAc(2)-PP-dolichol alpha-1,6-mannosyltransferase [Linderina macrospora]
MDLLDVVFALVISLSAICVPFTKVEESFFVQAVHDLYKSPVISSDYDHLTFPGVVPRSFVSPLLISAILSPIKLFSDASEGIWLQVASRLVLGWAVAWANSRLRKSIRRRFGGTAAAWYGIFCVCQFHMTFWTSRMLGNTIALVPMLLAQAYWIDGRRFTTMTVLLAFTAIVLRFDTVVFAAGMVLSSIRDLSWYAVKRTVLAAAGFAALTVAVDSYYWQTAWMWPELHVFAFNVVEQRSSEWGVSPAHYYVTHFLPRLLLGALPFAVSGVVLSAEAAKLAIPYMAAVAVFSANPHKEWRFIIYAVPVLNLCAALGIAKLVKYRRIRILVRLAAGGMAAASFAVVVLMTYISSLNYPGGHALSALHNMETSPNVHVHVHIDTYSAMTGVTRYGQLRSDWIYDKTEDLIPSQFANFTHLLTSEPDLHKDQFRVSMAVSGYAGVRLQPKAVLSGQAPIAIQQKPLVYIMQSTNL